MQTIFYGASQGEFGLNPGLPSINACKRDFKQFLQQFADVGEQEPSAGPLKGVEASYKYRDAIKAHQSLQESYLEVDLHDLDTVDHTVDLADGIRNKPLMYIPALEDALDEVFVDSKYVNEGEKEIQEAGEPIKRSKSQLMIVSRENAVNIRDLHSGDVEKLIVIPGVVIQASKVYHQARNMTLKCAHCGDQRQWELKLGMTSNLIPRACQARGEDQAGGIDQCPPDPYRIVPDLCTYWDVQTLKFQELPEHVPMGETPRHLNLVASRYLCDKVLPGSRVTVSGIWSTSDMSEDKSKSAVSVKKNYIHVLGFMDLSEQTTMLKRVSISNEDRMLRLSRHPSIRSKIYASIAPAVAAGFGGDCLTEIKEGIACLLFGGSRKVLPDGTKVRGDINQLLLGDAGMAKSQFLKFVETCAPIAIYTSGKGSSAVGLTASIIRDASGGYAVHGGAMVLADGGVVCIDEFDKMRTEDQVAIHEAMEQQTISIAKAGITTVLNTRCSVLAAANPAFGCFSGDLDTPDQMDFATTILSRFDMVFLVRDIRSKERDQELARHVIALHDSTHSTATGQEAPIELDELRAYISYARLSCQPRLNAEAACRLQNVYVESRRKVALEKRSNQDSGVPITVRQLEALVRLTEALAKMELRETATVEHAGEAIRLFTVSTLNSAQQTNMHMSEEIREKVVPAEHAIRRVLPIHSRLNRQQLQVDLEKLGFPALAVAQALKVMEMRVEIEILPNNMVRRLK